jgi:hypothetical protein
MELFTYDRKFRKSEVVDEFSSVVWTERYFGDGDFELVVPLSMEMIDKLSVGVFLGCQGSSEPMIIQNMSIEKETIKVTGISILPWLNNRFVKSSSDHTQRYWNIPLNWAGYTTTPGFILWKILKEMATFDSQYFFYSTSGLPHSHQLAITGLTLGRYDNTGPSVALTVPYGPLYDALRAIAETYDLGMRMAVTYTTDKQYLTVDSGVSPRPPADYFLEFTNYKGVDRTTRQTVNPPVRFSPQFDSLTNIKELQSIADQKTLIFTVAPSNPAGLATGLSAGRATTVKQWEPTVPANREEIWSFDVRAELVFCDDITTDSGITTAANLTTVLNQRAQATLNAKSFKVFVDGEIVPGNAFVYGRDYGLGDIIEIQGNSGAVQLSKVTEYIRTQDSTGERSYPTLSAIPTS